MNEVILRKREIPFNPPLKAKDLLVEMYKKGIKNDDIAKKLNDLGLKTDIGSRWTAPTVSKVANDLGYRKVKEYKSPERKRVVHQGKYREEPQKSLSDHYINALTEVSLSDLSSKTKELVIVALSKEISNATER